MEGSKYIWQEPCKN